MTIWRGRRGSITRIPTSLYHNELQKSKTKLCRKCAVLFSLKYPEYIRFDSHAFKLTLPKPYYAPSHFMQSCSDKPVSRLIVLNLSLPVYRMLLWCYISTTMAVPKTAIDKNSNFLLWKYKIRPSKYIVISPPT